MGRPRQGKDQRASAARFPRTESKPADESIRPTLGRFGVQLPPHFAHLLVRLIQAGGVVD